MLQDLNTKAQHEALQNNVKVCKLWQVYCEHVIHVHGIWVSAISAWDCCYPRSGDRSVIIACKLVHGEVQGQHVALW